MTENQISYSQLFKNSGENTTGWVLFRGQNLKSEDKFIEIIPKLFARGCIESWNVVTIYSDNNIVSTYEGSYDFENLNELKVILHVIWKKMYAIIQKRNKSHTLNKTFQKVKMVYEPLVKMYLVPNDSKQTLDKIYREIPEIKNDGLFGKEYENIFYTVNYQGY